MQKPLGIKILAWFLIVAGILSLGLMIFSSTTLQKTETSSLKMFYDTTMAVLGIIFGIGLLSIQKWAWFGTGIIFVATLVYQIISIPISLKSATRQSQVVGLVLGLVISGLIIFYLLRKDIRQLFKISK